jgi:predicted DNA-binding transcriptional regulator YafY
VEDVSKEFGVSRRTIFRDLNELKEMNIPIDYIPKKGFKLLHGYKIPPLMFNTKELAVIAVSLSFMKSQPIKSMATDAANVAIKINEAIPGDLKDYLYSLEKSVIVDPYSHHIVTTFNDGDWQLISDAIAFNKVISFNYKEGRDRRILSPYLIVYFEDHWNTIGFDHHKNAIRNFRLSGMNHTHLESEENYKQTKISDPLDFIYNSTKQKQQIVCEIRKSIADIFLSKIPARYSSSTNINTITIKFEFDNLHYLAKWFLQFGSDAQISAPQELIDEYKNELSQMMSSYT